MLRCLLTTIVAGGSCGQNEALEVLKKEQLLIDEQNAAVVSVR